MDVTTDAELVVVKKLAGIPMLTREAFEDATFPIAEEVQRVVRDAFSHDLDLGLLYGDGTGANPLGVVARAIEATGATLVGAIAAAKGEIGDSGGQATHVALSPSTAAAEEGRAGSDGHPVYPNGLGNLGGLEVVRVPGLTEPLVYDASRVYLVKARDWRVEQSTDYAPAFKGDKVALKVSGRFGAGLPASVKTIRRLNVMAA
ncbi:phage major capsid protein [Terrabacter sp. NPDC000476]|uniref:phage major capsid protein n=1 Tax=Terrabacter sp. NPDC000476 TaxID=3154258 RepID=UPI00331FAB23